MPFVAIHKLSKKLVDITEANKIFEPDECACQICEEPLIPKYGTGLKRPHFAHYPDTECAGSYGKHPESPEHMDAKFELAQLLKKEGAKTFIECAIPEAKRIADIMAEYPNGQKVIHEIQLSYISPFELQRRTESYTKAGYGISWWLGKQADVQRNHQYLVGKLGYSIEIELPWTSNSDKTLITHEKYVYEEEYLGRQYKDVMTRIVRTPYPFLVKTEKDKASWFKFLGTDGKISIGKVAGRRDHLVKIKYFAPFNKAGDEAWTYDDPGLGHVIYGELLNSIQVIPVVPS